VEDKRKRGLKKGYTTGTCAAAASKAAAAAFLTKQKVKDVEITLPTGQSVKLPVYKCEIENNRTIASVIKDAGDDPDVTNGAEIVAKVEIGVRGQGSGVRGIKAFQFTVHGSWVTVYGGKGIGIVTKPGLAVKVGEPAINPVPRKMIKDAVREVLSPHPTHPSDGYPLSPAGRGLGRGGKSGLYITISIPNGEEIAKKTMNPRLGIIGGISILGTTGIVEPLSLSAYRHSIICAIDVASASNCSEIVFSTGRSSEKVAEQILNLPEETFILVGDHMGYALKEAKGKGQSGYPSVRMGGGKKITIVGQFGKFSKLAAGHFETHCADSSIEFEFLAELAEREGASNTVVKKIRGANTARQVFFILKENGLEKVLKTACEKVKENSVKIAGTRNIDCVLVGYDGEVVIKL